MYHFVIGGHDHGRMGDSLAMVPFMLAACGAENTGAVVTGLNLEVEELIRPIAPFSYNHFRTPPTGCEREILLDVSRMHREYQLTLHMAQSYFRCHGWQVPDLPIGLPLPEISSKEQFGSIAVVAPYSWSDHNGNKFWPHQNWIAVIDRLRTEGYISAAYVVGSSTQDDAQIYESAAITPFFDRPLLAVLDLIRKASIFLSVDNGISHLAHYGGIAHHVLLYPGCLSSCWVRNPRGRMIQGEPSQVAPDAILYQARELLNGA